MASGVKPIKVLVVGDVNGRFTELFKRVSTVDKKAGPFDMLLIAGSFFKTTGMDLDQDHEWLELVKGSTPLPAIPIYILGPVNTEQVNVYKKLFDSKRKADESLGNDYTQGFEVIEGLTYLGKRGLLTGSTGLKIAYISGKESQETKPPDDSYFCEEDVRTLLLQAQNKSSSSPIDIFLTNQWPKNVTRHLTDDNTPNLNVLQQLADGDGSELIAKASYLMKPRYHFVAGGQLMYFERHPFRNHKVLLENQRNVTRFIALSNVGNKVKENKWIYAFNIVPSSQLDRTELVKQPEHVTENPYLGIYSEEMLEAQDASIIDKSHQQQFFYDMTPREDRRQHQGRGRGFRGRDNRGRGDRGMANYPHKRQHPDDQEPRGDGDFPPGQSDRRSRPRTEPKEPPGPCWFCLASPEVEKHLIVSIGEQAYLAMAKGGLTDDHMLILPVGHYRSTVETDEPEVLKEVDRFKSSLTKFFESQGKFCIFFERNYRSSHLQIQVVPLPMSFVKDLIDIITEVGSELHGIELKRVPDDCSLSDVISPGMPYFCWDVPDPTDPSSSRVQLFSRIRSGFPLQFGREVLAHERLLNAPDRIDWKACALEKDAATAVVKQFRQKFQPYDFTLE